MNAEQEPMKCYRCEKEYPSFYRYCPHCGRTLLSPFNCLLWKEHEQEVIRHAEETTEIALRMKSDTDEEYKAV